MGEVALRFQCFRYRFVLTELQSVIEGDCVAGIPVIAKQRDYRVTDLHRILRKDLFRQINSALTFCQRHDCTGSLSTQHKVRFPVPQTGSLINDSGS
ncbi:hypothetical protein ECC18A13_p10210 (plasmid) [Enterobacter sp. 18A13]|nr:hypothetical protein ECC18A13_p10210 [Enterobacter sp. 18A13]